MSMYSVGAGVWLACVFYEYYVQYCPLPKLAYI
jgi:hypothetical protein